MARVSNFVQVRADGKQVPAGMTVAEMLAQGWAPSKVVALRWEDDGAPVEAAAPHGIHGIVVPGAAFVASILDEDGSGTNSQLQVLSPDGAVQGRLPNRLTVSGSEVVGHYSWFEPAMEPGTDRFGVVFQAQDGASYRCDVDASEPRLLRAVPVR